MKTMCPPRYYNNNIVASYTLVHIMYGYTLLVPRSKSAFNKLRKEDNVSGPFKLCSLLSLLGIFCFNGTSNVEKCIMFLKA